jgi:D-alanyl-lipoteichoic acid acyltransferase DltB (MBOAT superfamily)
LLLHDRHERRCVNNNYDIEGFWRNWHSSFNRWLVRYMYIPLGGSRFKAANIWAIFSFVAIWHDVDLRLLVWAWVSCLFAGPEILAKWIAHCPAVRPWKDSWQFRHTCAVAAAINIVVLMVCFTSKSCEP